MIRRLIEALRHLVRRLARLFARRDTARQRAGVPLGGMREPAAYARGLPWLPHGDGRAFSPRDSALLKTLQRRATYALFAELGQSWVPAEVFRILDAEALPSKAVEVFCEEFGLRVEALVRGDATETARLTHCLDLLFCLHDIGARLPAATRADIVSAIRDGDREIAAQRIDVFRLALRAADDAAELEKLIPFPQGRQFAAFLHSFADNWLRLSMRDVQLALETCRRHRALHDRFERALSRLDALRAWAAESWPGNRRGREHRDTRDRMLAARQRLEQAIRFTTTWGLDALEQAIAELEQLADDLAALVVQVRGGGRSRGRAWQARWDSRARGDELTRWTWALEALGFAPRTVPDAAAVRTAFCRQAMRYHPDRNTEQPDEVQQHCRERFEEATRARNILDRGAPPGCAGTADEATLPELDLSA